MVGKILTILFWLVATVLIVSSLYAGRWALSIPFSVLFSLVVLAVDVHRHRGMAKLDRELLRTLLHVLSAVTVAASFMYWLAQMVLRGL